MITQTEVEFYVLINPYYEFVQYIASLLGIAGHSATIILAETGVDMCVFDDAKYLSSWCALSTSNNEFVGKKICPYCESRSYLKPMMVQCTLAAIKSKKEPYFSIKYGRIKKRCGHKKVIIAIPRMMRAVYELLV